MDSLAHVPDPDLANVILVKTKSDDFARVMFLEGGRVRVYAGGGVDREEATRVFDQEFRTGRGKHPPYQKP